MITRFVDNRWSIFFALLVVALIQVVVPYGQQMWSHSAPVVTMTGKVVGKTASYVDIHITGDKHRSCRYVRMSAMTMVDGRLIDAYLVRADGRPDAGATKPAGTYDLGVWRVHPVSSSTKALVFVQHDCDSQVILSKIAEVEL